MRIWLITDTHFGHDKMVELCGRPVDFSEKILMNLHKTVQPGSMLIHLGDVCIGKDVLWHGKLSEALKDVPKILIRGNHDRQSYSWYINHGWNFVAETISDTLFGVKFLLSHLPVKENGYEVNIHGHFHNSDHRRHEPELLAIKSERQKLLAIEHTNYMPVQLQHFLQL